MTQQNTNTTTEQQKTEQKPFNVASFDCLCVTSVQVYPFKDQGLGHMKALAQIVLNDQLVIRGLRVMDGTNGLFVSYPNDPFFKGEEYRSICNPITRQLREHIENCILEKFQNTLAADPNG